MGQDDMGRHAPVPEFYADHCMILDNGVTAQCLYKVTPPILGPSVPEPVVLVRTPLSLLKLHAFLMRRHSWGRLGGLCGVLGRDPGVERRRQPFEGLDRRTIPRSPPGAPPF